MYEVSVKYFKIYLEKRKPCSSVKLLIGNATVSYIVYDLL